jgi:hypothetical protein
VYRLRGRGEEREGQQCEQAEATDEAIHDRFPLCVLAFDS